MCCRSSTASSCISASCRALLSVCAVQFHPHGGPIRFRLALRTYAPWGVRVVSQTKSRKIPTRKILPLFFASRSVLLPPRRHAGPVSHSRRRGGCCSSMGRRRRRRRRHPVPDVRPRVCHGGGAGGARLGAALRVGLLGGPRRRLLGLGGPRRRLRAAAVRVPSRSIPPPWGVNPISSGSPHVRPWGCIVRVVPDRQTKPRKIPTCTRNILPVPPFFEQVRGAPGGGVRKWHAGTHATL